MTEFLRPHIPKHGYGTITEIGDGRKSHEVGPDGSENGKGSNFNRRCPGAAEEGKIIL
jgi:hypothetical protein